MYCGVDTIQQIHRQRERGGYMYWNDGNCVGSVAFYQRYLQGACFCINRNGASVNDNLSLMLSIYAFPDCCYHQYYIGSTYYVCSNDNITNRTSVFFLSTVLGFGSEWACQAKGMAGNKSHLLHIQSVQSLADKYYYCTTIFISYYDNHLSISILLLALKLKHTQSLSRLNA